MHHGAARGRKHGPRDARVEVMRHGFPLLRALAVAIALCGAPALAGSAGGDADATRPVERVRLTNDGTSIVLDGRAGTRTYDIEAWRAWARDHLASAVPGPLEIGTIEVGVDDFDRFGVASAAPGGDRVLFSVTTYAVLTTLSLVGVLDAEDGSIRMLPTPRVGDLQDPAWAPDGGYVAYALGSARSSGEEVRVEALDDADGGVALTRRKLHAAWLREGLPTAGDVTPDGYLPWFRDLAWSSGRLRFTADAPGAGRGEPPPPGADEPSLEPVRWSVGPEGQDLRPEGPARTTP